MKQDIVDKVIYELTTRCNLRCPGCYMGERLDDNVLEFDIDMFEKVLDMTMPSQVDLLGGEPLLWPNLRQGVEMLEERGIKAYLFSNLVGLDKEMASFLLKKGVFVTGKMNIGDPDDPEQLAMQGKMIGTLNMALVRRMFDNIQLMLDAGFRQPQFSIENLLRPENIKYAADFARWCLERDIRPDIELPACAGDSQAEYWSKIPNRLQIISLVNQVSEIYEGKLLPPHITARCTYSGVPSQIEDMKGALYFRPNGDIQACSGNQTVLANFLTDEDPIGTALESEIVKTRRNLTQDQMQGACNSCMEWDYCGGGCRATAENLGDAFASDPRCWIPYT